MPQVINPTRFELGEVAKTKHDDSLVRIKNYQASSQTHWVEFVGKLKPSGEPSTAVLRVAELTKLVPVTEPSRLFLVRP